MQNLHKRIDTILKEEKRAYEANGRQRGGLGSFNQRIGGGVSMAGEVPKLLASTSSQETIESSNAALTLKLYSSLNPDDKVEMASYLNGCLRRDSEYADVAYLIFFVLYRIGKPVEALKKAQEALKGDSQYGYSNLLGMLSNIVSLEYTYIDPSAYDNIRLVLEDDDEHNFQLLEKINSAEIKILEQELADVNPEVNYDRDKVISIWNEKFPESVIPAVINEIEEYFQVGEFTQTKFATCISKIRVLIADVTKKLAIDVSAKTRGTKIDENSNEHRVFDYLRSQKVITDNEWQIIRSLYALASNAGAHAVTSNREYARLIKNMSYEILLLLLSKNE